ncbi:MAG: hypothetical protein U0269_24610 [Polyangiales bacterium]
MIHRRVALALSFVALSCRPPQRAAHRALVPPPVTPSVTPSITPSITHASIPDASARPSSARDAPLFYGVINGLVVEPDGAATFAAGNLRVEMSSDGAVRTATEAPPTTVRWRWSLGGARTAFITADEQVLVSDTFTGPFDTHVALDRHIIRHGTGAIPSVRTEDGQWHRIDRAGAVALEALPEGTVEVHFADERRAYAVAAPGKLLTSSDAGAHWTEVALANDVALRFDFTADGRTLVRAGRAQYAMNNGALTVTQAARVHEDSASPEARARVYEHWYRYWREHLWPTGADWFWIVQRGQQRVAIEHRGALVWWGAGEIHRMNRDGSVRSTPVRDARSCQLQRFGAGVLAYCRDEPDRANGKVIELDLATLTPRVIAETLNDIVTVRGSSDGEAIAFGHVPGGMTGPDNRLWTRAQPTLQPVSGVFPNASVMVEGATVLVLDQIGLQLRHLGDGGAPTRYVQLTAPAAGASARANVLAMSVRPDGGYAVVRRAERASCEVVLGSDVRPSVRAALPNCAAPSGIAFADERFGVVVDLLKTWVTTDGGARWSAIPRSTGVASEDVRTILDRLPPPHVEGGAIVVSPHQRIEAGSVPVERHWARAPYARTDLTGDEDAASPPREQWCEPARPTRSTPPSRIDVDLRSVVLVHQRTRAEVFVERTATGVTARVQWSGDETGPGRFSGPAPWREPAADFDRGDAVGYVLRAVSRAGVLLERCLVTRAGEHTQHPEQCDVRWLTRDHRAVAMELQNPGPNAGGAWVLRAAPDGLGWVVELGAARRSDLFEWKQWQHWRADGTLARWGDVVRDWQMNEHTALARIDGQWGVVTDAGFVAHGTDEARTLEPPSDVEFCRPNARLADDVWYSEGDYPHGLPVVARSNAVHVLRRSGADWCIERSYAAPWTFLWSTVEVRNEMRAWTLVAQRRAPWGSGTLRVADERGTVTESPLRCEPPPASDDDDEQY